MQHLFFDCNTTKLIISKIKDIFTLWNVQLDDENFPLIYDQERGAVVNHRFPLPPDYQGDVIIKIVTASGHQDELIDVDYFTNKSKYAINTTSH